MAKEGTLVAKYVDRKMSPSTGLDTNYIYEWRMVKNTDPNTIYKEGKYGIYRSLTVNGEVRYDDLMGFGNTPTEATNSTPVETSLDKAEKFGVFKTKFDKEIAERQVKQEAAKIAEQEESEDKARFDSVFSPLRTLKGVREIPIKINTYNPSSNTNSKKDVKGYDLGYGIGIAISEEGKYQRYTVTHLNSGLAMGSEWKDRKDAIALARAVAMVTDWSQYAGQEDIPDNLKSKAAALVRAARNSILSKELAEDLDKGIKKSFGQQYRQSISQGFEKDKAEKLAKAEVAMASFNPSPMVSITPHPISTPAPITKAISTLPKTCKITKQHTDGDITMKCPGGKSYMITTSGDMFKEVKKQAEKRMGK